LLRGQLELEPVDRDFGLRLALGALGEHDLSAIGGRQMNIYHLNGGELFEDCFAWTPRVQGHAGRGSS
jgi:hypothetical protein